QITTSKVKKINAGGFSLNERHTANVQKKPVRNTATSRAPPTTTKNVSSVNKNHVSKPTMKPATDNPAVKNPVTTASEPGKKRQPWDLKGKLKDLEVRNAALTRKLNMTKEQMASERDELLLMHDRKVKELEEKIRESRKELEENKRMMTQKAEELEMSISNLENEKASLTSDLLVTEQERTELKLTVDGLTSAKAEVSTELMSTKVMLEEAMREVKQLKALTAEQDNAIKEQNEKLIKNESERRLLHNTIQELKGNIRVFCRVRPLIGEELTAGSGEIGHIDFPDKAGDGKILELKKLGEISTSENSMYEFNFDRVFAPNCTQREVFEEISQLVQSALDGYHVCIFAYGQTGSGKTYTMEGPNNPDCDNEGMIPRAVNQVFASSENLKDKGWQYEMEVSFLEIYNETIRDLIGNGQDDVKHEIKMTSASSMEVTVTNLTSVKVSKRAQVYKLLAKAGEKRAVAETNCNLKSSRSHSLFQMKICGHNTVTQERCMGLLNLIDLAGSERLKASGSQGQRLKETQSINKSLSNLGNVIMALVNKDSYIPYRNSKLTHLLQHCLGGNSKVLMFVNVSPKEECFSETLNSLRFASMVNACNIGTATKRIK
ncbi:hypothetical protein LSH36_1348g00016, partial [Paralvinella palmiformis]